MAGFPYGGDMGPGLGGPMFDPKSILYGMLSKAPRFLLSSLDSIILGILAAYVVLSIFLGGSNFFVRVLGLAFVVGVGYGLARLLRFILSYTDRVFPSSSFQNGREKPGRTDSSSPSSTNTKSKDALSTKNHSEEDGFHQGVVGVD